MFFGGDPFEHFAGMHGQGGGGGGGGSRRGGPSRDVDTTKLYETLGVSLSFFSREVGRGRRPVFHDIMVEPIKWLTTAC